MSDIVLVDGSDLASSNRIVQVLDDGLDTPVKRGANIVIPYAAGELVVPKKIDARDFTVGILVKGTGVSYTSMRDELETLYGILPDLTADDTTCTLTLRKDLTGGYVDLTSSAEYTGGLSPTLVAPAATRLTARFRLLDGGFS